MRSMDCDSKLEQLKQLKKSIYPKNNSIPRKKEDNVNPDRLMRVINNVSPFEKTTGRLRYEPTLSKGNESMSLR